MDTSEKMERLGRTWCKLNCFEWDSEVLGELPEGVDKMQAIRNAAVSIEEIIGKANTSRYWHLFELNRTEEEWLRWYLVERFRPGIKAGTKAKKTKRNKRCSISAIWIAILATILLTILIQTVLH